MSASGLRVIDEGQLWGTIEAGIKHLGIPAQDGSVPDSRLRHRAEWTPC